MSGIPTEWQPLLVNTATADAIYWAVIDHIAADLETSPSPEQWQAVADSVVAALIQQGWTVSPPDASQTSG
jgi:hypothetical protein